MGRGIQVMPVGQDGSIPEPIREEECLRYGAPLLAESVVNDSAKPLSHLRLSASSDPAIAAYAQLLTFKLDAERAFISLFDSKRQHIIAEATRSTSIEFGPREAVPLDEKPTDLLVSGTAVPRGHGICELVLDRPAIVDSGIPLLPVFTIPDITQDDRYLAKPDFGLRALASTPRFYAGVPIRSPHGIDIGVCCILGSKPRDGLDPASQRFLRHTSQLIMSHLQSRVSTDSYRRHERMVRGLGSMVEGSGSMSKWHHGAANPAAFVDREGREGALNEEQQRAQGEMGTSALPDVPKINADQVSLEVPVDNTSPEGPTSSPDPLGMESELKSGHSVASFIGTREDDNQIALKSLFGRAANIVRESIEIEGALFLDAQIESYGGLVPQSDEGLRNSDGSSGDESILTDEADGSQSTCRVLGFSTSHASSINGHAASDEHASVPDTFLEKILRRYPAGQVFNFDEDGASIWSVSDSEEGEPASAGGDERPNSVTSANRPRKGDCQFIKRMFPGARSVALIPLWDSHRVRWFAGGFVWTCEARRTFSVQGELSYLKAFGSATMTEVARIDVLRESKAKEDVLGSLSHEIRSPLHGIILGVELLHDSDLTGFQVDVVHTVENCGRTLLDVLDHLLDFSKVNNFTRASKKRTRGSVAALDSRSSVEAGMMSIFSDLNLDILLEEVVESVYAGFSFQNTSNRWATRERADTSYFQHEGTQRRVEVVRQPDLGVKPPDLNQADDGVKVYISVDPNVSWAFYAQPGAVRRIIMNIFGNALKYTNRGNIIVSMSQEPVSTKRKSLRRNIVFSVSDSGRGIGNEYLQTRLFTPFAQENQLSSGTGLGLSIVKQIIQGLGGRISVESRVGRGTTVRIVIPLRMSSPKASPTNVSIRARKVLSDMLNDLRGVSVALVGFSSDFGADRPLAAETSETKLSPRLFMEVMCQRYLGLRVLSEEETLTEVPSVYLCAEEAFNRVPALDGQRLPAPVVVICHSALASHQLATAFAPHASNETREFIAQPVGARKLAKVLAVALEKWRHKRDGGHVNYGQLTPPKDAVESQASSLSTTDKVPAKALHPGEETQRLDNAPPDLSSGPLARTDGSISIVGGRKASTTDVLRSEEQDLTHHSDDAEAAADFLLVDDNPINLKILSSYIRKLGRTYEAAMNGLEALEACRARRVPYRCIFMDISMPVMDGLEAARHIRAHEKSNALAPAYIVALSGLASAHTQQDAFASGIDLFLTKPVPLKELGEILSKIGD